MPGISVPIFVSLLQGNRVCSPLILRAIEAPLAQSAESAILDYMISIVNIFASIHPTVLKFGEHARVSVFYTPTNFHVNRITRS